MYDRGIWVRFAEGARYSFLHSVQPGYWEWGLEADNLPSSSAKFKNAWSYASTSPYMFTVWLLFTHRDNNLYVRSEVLTVVAMKNPTFWDITLCNPRLIRFVTIHTMVLWVTTFSSKGRSNVFGGNFGHYIWGYTLSWFTRPQYELLRISWKISRKLMVLNYNLRNFLLTYNSYNFVHEIRVHMTLHDLDFNTFSCWLSNLTKQTNAFSQLEWETHQGRLRKNGRYINAMKAMKCWNRYACDSVRYKMSTSTITDGST
jgi:hypothetical protein